MLETASLLGSHAHQFQYRRRPSTSSLFFLRPAVSVPSHSIDYGPCMLPSGDSCLVCFLFRQLPFPKFHQEDRSEHI